MQRLRQSYYVCSHDPQNCLHTDTDHRGSGPKLHRTLFKMCQTYIAETSQDDWTVICSTADTVKKAHVATINLVRNIAAPVHCTGTELLRAISMFVSNAQTSFEPNGAYTSEDAHSLLKDSIEAVVAARSNLPQHTGGSSHFSSTHQTSFAKHPTAYVAYPRREPKNHNLMPDIQGCKLPVVNILEDPGIWACIDDGCNQCCHGDRWARNM